METDKKAKLLEYENHRISIYPDSLAEAVKKRDCADRRMLVSLTAAAVC